MSQYVTIEKQGNHVRFADGTSFEVGQARQLGVGSIILRRTEDGALVVVRLTRKGNHQYTQDLDQDGKWLVGPHNCQWQKPWQQEEDQMLRVLRRMDVPVSSLRRVGAGQAQEVFEESLGENHWRDDLWGCSYVTDGVKTLSPKGDSDSETLRTGTISGATFAVERRIRGGRELQEFVGKVFVWPGCDPYRLADAIAGVKFGEDTNWTMPGHLEDAALSAAWIACAYEITGHPTKGDRVQIEHEAGAKQDFCFLAPNGAFEGNVRGLRLLVQTHGPEILSQLFDDEQRAFLAAYRGTKETAAEFIFARYRVVAVARGDERHLKFATIEAPEKLGDLDSTAIPGVGDYADDYQDLALAHLLKVHPNLSSLLFVRAKEREELVPAYGQPRSEFKLVDGVWCFPDMGLDGEMENPSCYRAWNNPAFNYPICSVDEAVNVGFRNERYVDVDVETGEEVAIEGPHPLALEDALICLSQPVANRVTYRIGNVSPQSGLRVVSVLSDGSPAYLNGCEILLLVKPGETKHFVFHVAHGGTQSWMGYSIWAVTVTHAADGALTFIPYDNGKLYSCSGINGEEVRSVVLGADLS